MEEKIHNLIKDRGPWFLKETYLSKLVYRFLAKYLKINETIYAGDFIKDMSGPEAFNWLGENYTANCEIKGIENIPSSGKSLIVSNHPMGPADAIAIYHQTYKVRKDIFFFANELFIYLVGSFENIFAPVVWDKEKEVHTASKKTYRNIKSFFLDNRIGIIFPSGRLSKLTFFGIKDREWEKTPIIIAERHDCQLVPIFIKARNSWFFYFASYVSKQLRDISQLNELFNKKNKRIKIIIGKPVLRSDLPEDRDEAIEELRRLSESLKKV